MILEFHDAEVGNTLVARVEVDYDYQAEQWVQDWYHDPRDKQVVQMLLLDSVGERARWEKQEDGRFALVWKSTRFVGEWVLGLAYPNR